MAQAIFAEPNNTIKFCEVLELGVEVHRGMTHEEIIIKAPCPTDDVVGILKSTKTISAATPIS